MTVENRWQTIQSLWQEHHWLYVLSGFFGGVMFFPLLQFIVDDLSELLQGLVPEAVGIIFTVLFIDALYRRREEQRRLTDQQTRLIRESGSPDNATCLNAIRELRACGWITGPNSLLIGAHLVSADLKNANLFDANLSGAILSRADLTQVTLSGAVMRDTKLRNANLSGISLHNADLTDAKMDRADLSEATLYRATLRNAVVRNANLHKTNLVEADLHGAKLTGANLTEAVLARADLTGADLREADLSGARLEDAVLTDVRADRRTRLPDGSYWEYGIDLSVFTESSDSDEAG